MLTQEILKELIHYDPDTGIFTWKERGIKWFKRSSNCKWWNSRYSNKQAGHIHENSGMVYIVIRVLKTRYQGHQLAILYEKGDFVKEVDHIDGDGTNNKIKNLREVTHLENSKNQKLRKNNKTGFNGIDYRNKKYKVRIGDNCERLWIGTYDTLEEAIEARKEAEIKYGYHENHGRK
jgi:hypothetical protein